MNARTDTFVLFLSSVVIMAAGCGMATSPESPAQAQVGEKVPDVSGSESTPSLQPDDSTRAEDKKSAGDAPVGAAYTNEKPPGSVKRVDLGDVGAPPEVAKFRGPEAVATGVGTDPQSAEQNALVNAVEQVVGLLVDAETIVSNDQIVRDQVLTYSRGFVEHHKEIARWQKDGLHYVRIRALVSATRLGEKLETQNVALRPLEGDKIAIRIKLEEDFEDKAKRMFRKAVADFAPDKLLTVTLAEGKPAVQRGPNGVKLTVSYRLASNLDAWKSIRANLVPLLEQISPTKRSGAYLEDQGFQFSGTPPKVFSERPPKADPLWVFKEPGPGGAATAWEEYQLPDWLRPDVRALASRISVRYIGGDKWAGYAVNVSLLDEQDRVIAEADRFFPHQNLSCGCPYVNGYLVFDWVPRGMYPPWTKFSIGPLLFTGNGFRQTLDLSETFTLDTNQLARVKNYAASIVNRAQ